MNLSIKLSLTLSIVFTCLCGCNNLVVTNRPFFASATIQDTLDNYMSNIDYSIGKPSLPLVTHIIVHDMWEHNHPVLLLITSEQSEISFASIDKNISSRYYGKYNGQLVNLSFNPKYQFMFKRRLKQSKEADREFKESRKCAVISCNKDIAEGYLTYEIMEDGALKRQLYRKSIYQKENQ